MDNIIKTIEPNEKDELAVEFTMNCKWGFDGSTGQSQYKQRFCDVDASDKCLFSTMLVPLDLNDGNISIWRNPVPSSTRFCRPIKICYEKETAELLAQERDYVENQIKSLKKSVVNLLYNDKYIYI